MEGLVFHNRLHVLLIYNYLPHLKSIPVKVACIKYPTFSLLSTATVSTFYHVCLYSNLIIVLMLNIS